MILIADSGSTKTHWCLLSLENNTNEHFFTTGINPFFQSQTEIVALLRSQLLPFLHTTCFDSINFYGAGCATQKQCDTLRSALHAVFNYRGLTIESDLMAANHAMCQNKAGIVAILGTGSNSCFYDGHSIQKQVPSLGYILGDEGSGAMMGRVLVSNVLKNQLPEELCNRFFNTFNTNMAEIMERTYRMPFPNRFLASLSVFLLDNIEIPEISSIVEDSFELFFKRNIKQYNYKQYPVHIVGSVGFNYREILNRVAEKNKVKLGNITSEPMEGLVNYYTELFKKECQ